MIDSKLMKRLVKEALQELEGEWLVIGGTVLPLMGVDHRVTVDIDLVNLDFKKSNEGLLKLMAIAERLKLPVEAVNQAGAYFVSQVKDLRSHLVVFAKSKQCTVFRPDVYLYIRLKLSRFSESDLEDCLAFVKLNPEEFQAQKKLIQSLMKGSIKTASPQVKARLEHFVKVVSLG